MTSTQVPIIAWEKRYMTPRECSKLQSMDTLLNLPDNPTKAFEALGNAVNVNLVESIASKLLVSKSQLRSNIANNRKHNSLFSHLITPVFQSI
jgi:DNA (cytosine-5)-methyltransferase 1